MRRRRSRSPWSTGYRRRRLTRSEEKLIGTLVATALLLGVVGWVIENAWPLLLLVLGGAIAWSIYRQRQRELLLRALSLADIDSMDGTQFELYLARLLAFYGYDVTHTGSAGDQGCDLVLEKDGHRIACQTKRYRKPVTNDAVAEAVASKAYHGCDEAMVITSSYFTNSARELARANGCRLIDRDELAQMISRFQESAKRSEEERR